jgi:hypothetical protein
VIVTDESSAPRCTLCGEDLRGGGNNEHAAACEALRIAAEAGARPTGVPVRVHAAYVEARQALRADAPVVAIRVLQWLLSHLAETRGVNPSLTLSAKVAALSEAGVISKTIRPDLLEKARSATSGSDEAWALMTVTEHALSRAYLRRV